MKRAVCWLLWMFLVGWTCLGQSSSNSGTVPNLIRFSGTLRDGSGQPLSGVVGATFAVYSSEQGGSPLWVETQNVQADKAGHYSVVLGSTTSQGLPQTVFTSGEARWLGVQPEGQAEQPRVLLVSVPYALKAADADTLGGFPASAFLTGNASQGSASSNGGATPTLTGKGKPGFIASWKTSSQLSYSNLFQSTAGNLGIGTITPAGALDINGTGIVRNTLTLFPNGSNPTLAISGTAFNVGNTGMVSFVSGQSFPGAGTITGVNTVGGSGLTGGGTSGSLNLALTNSCSANQVLQWNGSAWVCTTITGGGAITGVTAGTDLAGGGTSGNVTLNLDLTKVPQLGTPNLFTGTQTVGVGDLAVSNGSLDLPLTTVGKLGVLNMGGIPFLHACCASTDQNTYVGANAGSFNAGNGGHNVALGYQALTINTGNSNTAVGWWAMFGNTTGSSDVAVGTGALQSNTGGTYNTGVGDGALNQTTTGQLDTALGEGAGTQNKDGSNNTFIGANANTSSPGLSFATAIGSNAVVSESNALVLGGTGQNAVKVGIGTATPAYTLDVQGTGNFTGLITFAPNQTFPGSGTVSGVTTPAGSGLIGGANSGNVTLSLTNSCANGQVLTWNGGGWVCTGLSGGGTITGVTAGTDLLGGGTSGNVTLNLDTSKVPQLATANNFAATQTVNGLLALTGSGNGVQFPDGTLQTTAATGGGGIPSGFMILGTSSTAPLGYTLSGTIVSGNVAYPVVPMPTARELLGAATVSGKIYAIGGYNVGSGGYLTVNEVYDPSTHSWSTKKPMLSAKASFAAATYGNGVILAIGGVSGNGITADVEEYDPAGDTWVTGPLLPTPREGLAAATDSLGYLYAIGGKNKAVYLKDMYQFNGTWTAKNSMPSPRAYLASAAVNGKIYAIGGYDGNAVLATVEVYDTQQGTWAAAAPMPTARRDLTAVVLNGKIYAIGGSDGQTALNLVEVYDPSTNVWSGAPSPLAARANFAAVAVNGYVYVMGGNAGTSILDTVQQYSPPQTLYTFTKN